MFDQNFEHTQFVREKNRLKFGKFVKKKYQLKKPKTINLCNQNRLLRCTKLEVLNQNFVIQILYMLKFAMIQRSRRIIVPQFVYVSLSNCYFVFKECLDSIFQ